MKKRLLYRILGIGFLHLVLYVYLIPFVIYPRFGNNGLMFAIVAAVVISITILGKMFITKKKVRR